MVGVVYGRGRVGYGSVGSELSHLGPRCLSTLVMSAWCLPQ